MEASRRQPDGGIPDEVLDQVDLIDAAIYADIFDCAATEEELWRYSRAPIGRRELREMLDRDQAMGEVMSGRDGLYCLRGREQLLETRAERQTRAGMLQRRARRVARVLRRVPFVRGLLLTGSAGADDAPAGADLDLLVLVEPNRLATVFTLLGTLSRLLTRNLLCPNHYLATDSLQVDRRRDIYVARELAQARPLCGEASALRGANGWIKELLPNASETGEPGHELRASRLQRLLEWPLRGRSGHAIERRLSSLARSRLNRHYRGHGADVPERVAADLEMGTQLRFHGGIEVRGVLGRYERRRAAIGQRLANLEPGKADAADQRPASASEAAVQRR